MNALVEQVPSQRIGHARNIAVAVGAAAIAVVVDDKLGIECGRAVEIFDELAGSWVGRGRLL
jgi:hypothetical protein